MGKPGVDQAGKGKKDIGKEGEIAGNGVKNPGRIGTVKIANNSGKRRDKNGIEDKVNNLKFLVVGPLIATKMAVAVKIE